MNTNASNTEHPYIHCVATKELPPAPPLDSLIESNITKIIVLDFDGVLNPLSAGTLGKKHFPTDRTAVVSNPHHANNPTKEPPSYMVKWSTKLVGELNGILSDHDAVVVWLTTWKQHAGTLAPWGGPAQTPAVSSFVGGARGVPPPPQGTRNQRWKTGWMPVVSLSTSRRIPARA